MSVAFSRHRPSWEFEEFNKGVACGWFENPNVIPFLGPECGRVGLERSPTTSVIRARVAEVARQLPRETEQYLNEVVIERLPDSDDVTPVPPGLEDDDYYAFLVQVVQLGMSATQLFTSMISHAGSAVVDWRRHEETMWLEWPRDELVEAFEPDRTATQPGAETGLPNPGIEGGSGIERILSTYVHSLEGALAVAERLQQRARTASTRDQRTLGDGFDDHLWQLFGADGIVAGLRSIEHSTITGSDPAKHQGPTTVTLRGEQVEWLTSLVWHVLRFDVPLYPSADELAFQLSMTCWPKGRTDDGGLTGITKPELSLATQNAADPDRVATRVAWAIDRATGSGGRGQYQSEFYASVAMVLLEHASRFEPNRRRARTTGGHGYQPVAFSSSFDWELEVQLVVHAQNSREALTVIVPVMVVAEGSPAGLVQWVYATIDHSPANEADAWEALSQPDWHWVPLTAGDIAPAWPVEKGVSVVKVNGSPLHYDLDGSRIDEHPGLLEGLSEPDTGFMQPWAPSGIDGQSVLRHALVLSEFELLRAVSLEIQKLGPDFIEALRADSPQTPQTNEGARRLVFVGHPISDWITRVRVLSRFFMPQSDTADGTDAQATNILKSYLVGPEADLMRASLLGWADIRPVADKHSRLAEALAESEIVQRRAARR